MADAHSYADSNPDEGGRGPLDGSGGTSPARGTSEPAEYNSDLVDLADMLLRQWRLLIMAPLIAGLLGLGISFLIAPTYTAMVAFVPESDTPSSIPPGFAGLAGEFGLSLGREATQSPQFYAAVLTSRELLNRVLLSRYPDPRHEQPAADSTRLVDLLARHGNDRADSLHNGRKRLERSISVNVDNRTNIVRLNVESPFPALCADVANRFIDYLNDFNTHTRQSQARARRQFAHQQVIAAGEELREAEEQLKQFYQQNRSWQDAPQLAFEEGRLRRQVEIQQEVYLTLRREYETHIERLNLAGSTRFMVVVLLPQTTTEPYAADVELKEYDIVTIYGRDEFRQARTVSISGMVNEPGDYPYRNGMTLKDLVLMARGFTDGAYLDMAEIARLPEDRSGGTLAIRMRIPLDSSYLFEPNATTYPSLPGGSGFCTRSSA